jgi:hypothetical protein
MDISDASYYKSNEKKKKKVAKKGKPKKNLFCRTVGVD